MRDAILACLRRAAAVFAPVWTPDEEPDAAIPAPETLSRRRALVLLSGLGAGFALLGGRLYNIQIGQHEELAAIAAGLQDRTRPLPFRRGDILSSDGQLLAREIQVPFAMIDPGQIAELVELEKVRYEDLLMLIDRLAPSPEARARVQGKLRDPRCRYAVIADPIREEDVRLLESLGTPGLHIRYRPERLYLGGSQAANLIGLTQVRDTEGLRTLVGIEGVEKVFDERLRGKPGASAYFRDRRGRPVARPGVRPTPARNGEDLTLTIDAVVQSVTETALDHLMERCAPDKAQVVLMRPDGRILAAACRPHFDPATRSPLGEEPGELVESMRFLPLFENFEPGSTFKPVVTALFLQHGWVRPSDRFDCDSPYRSPLRRKRITNYRNRSLGVLDPLHILEKSSNVGMVRMIERAHPLALRNSLTKLGFGQRALDLFPHEEVGMFPPAEEWTKRYNLPGLSYGYWINVTSLQLVRAYCALANGGLLPSLRLVEGEEARYERVLQPDICAFIRHGLRLVVESGTARSVDIEGYAIGGKTGTAEIQENGRYTSRNRCSFVGIAPIDDPQVIFACIADNPTRGGANTGGGVAAPVIEEILNEILPYLYAEEG